MQRHHSDVSSHANGSFEARAAQGTRGTMVTRGTRSFSGALQRSLAHYAIPHATAGFLARQVLGAAGVTRPRVVTTLHGTDITLVGNDPSYSEIVAFSIEQSDGVTAVSNSLRESSSSTSVSFP